MSFFISLFRSCFTFQKFCKYDVWIIIFSDKVKLGFNVCSYNIQSYRQIFECHLLCIIIYKTLNHHLIFFLKKKSLNSGLKDSYVIKKLIRIKILLIKQLTCSDNLPKILAQMDEKTSERQTSHLLKEFLESIHLLKRSHTQPLQLSFRLPL